MREREREDPISYSVSHRTKAGGSGVIVNHTNAGDTFCFFLAGFYLRISDRVFEGA